MKTLSNGWLAPKAVDREHATAIALKNAFEKKQASELGEHSANLIALRYQSRGVRGDAYSLGLTVAYRTLSQC